MRELLEHSRRAEVWRGMTLVGTVTIGMLMEAWAHHLTTAQLQARVLQELVEEARAMTLDARRPPRALPAKSVLKAQRRQRRKS